MKRLHDDIRMTIIAQTGDKEEKIPNTTLCIVWKMSILSILIAVIALPNYRYYNKEQKGRLKLSRS